MKYLALFVIFENVAKFEVVICCILKVALYGLNSVGRCVIPWEFLGKSFKHIVSCREIYSV